MISKRLGSSRLVAPPLGSSARGRRRPSRGKARTNRTKARAHDLQRCPTALGRGPRGWRRETGTGVAHRPGRAPRFAGAFPDTPTNPPAIIGWPPIQPLLKLCSGSSFPPLPNVPHQIIFFPPGQDPSFLPPSQFFFLRRTENKTAQTFSILCQSNQTNFAAHVLR
jgi:hypothetical protein